jgi:hypothetical protein
MKLHLLINITHLFANLLHLLNLVKKADSEIVLIYKISVHFAMFGCSRFVGKNYVQMVVHCLSLQVAKIHAKKKKKLH